MGMLLSRLLIVVLEEDLGSTNYHIAKTILENFEIISILTIGQVAALCSVSKSTISKFIRKIGFDDYFEFRDAIPNVPHSRYSYNNNVMQYLESNDFGKYVDLITYDLQLLKKSIETSNASRLAADIAKFDKVAAFGLLFSQTAAVDLQIKLAYNDKFIFTSLNDVKQQQFIENADADTLIIIFSHSGEYILKHQMLEGDVAKSIFDKTAAKVVVITSNQELAKDSRVDYCVEYKCSSNISIHSTLYSLITDYITLKFREQLTS